ncbi:MAG: type I-C CRISPR-associated protein Cas8c/Csd1, partial [bacterium]|nr:type I-C CRISPR-associated protein Cas8c/Csd1 [bacterium]
AKDKRDHEKFLGLLQLASNATPELAGIASTLSQGSVQHEIRKALRLGKARSYDLATPAVGGSGKLRVLVEETSWHAWWKEFLDSQKSKQRSKSVPLMRCLLSGELVRPALSQDRISGLSDVGGLPTGDVLSSFDKEAFRHFGLTRGQNAAISESGVKSLADSLNALLQNNSRRFGSTRIAYWYDHSLSEAEDPLVDLFEGSETRAVESRSPHSEKLADEPAFTSRAERLHQLINSRARDDLTRCRYRILIVSGNSGRVVMREWLEGSLPDLVSGLRQWFKDTSVITRDGRRIIRLHRLSALLGGFSRELKDLPSYAVASLIKCVLSGRACIPDALMAMTLAKLRIELMYQPMAPLARYGFLRACCIRNTGTPHMSFQIDESIDDPAYVCGRIMAILTVIQRRALGSFGTDAIQRFYPTASTSPALVLGQLMRTAQSSHLPMIERDLQVELEKQLGELWRRLKSAPPISLSLQQQTLFAMGFYQQQATDFVHQLEVAPTD